MSDEFEGEESEGVKSLRKALEKANEASAAKDAQLATLLADKRTRDVEAKFAEFKINPKIARLVPSDVEPDKLESWIGENADWLGVKPVEESPANTAEEEAQGRISGFSMEGGGESESPYLQGIASAKTPKELDAFIYASQAGKR